MVQVAVASWGTDDQIIFGTFGAGLFRVSGDGGEAEALTALDEEQGELTHYWPFIIPGGEAVVFAIAEGGLLASGQLAVLDLGTGEITRLGLAGTSPHYVSTGHLVYAAVDDVVRAVPFDAATLEVVGDPVPLVEGVVTKSSGAADFSISENGRLVYASGRTDAGLRDLVWVDRDGREEPIAAPSRNYVIARVSPDGTRVALDTRDQENDIWVWDFAREVLTRLTVMPRLDQHGHWTPDGRRVVFSSTREGPSNIYSKAADGTGPVERLTEGDTSLIVNGVTPDGALVIAEVSIAGDGIDQPGGRKDLIVVSLDGSHATETLLSTEFDEQNAALSPDGVWLAYQSNASGRAEVYVRPFPDSEGGRWQISAAGGRYPVWSRDGHELFYQADTQLMTVPVRTEAGFGGGVPEPLFEANYFFGAPSRNYDVAPDGRFLMIKTVGQGDNDAPPSEIHVVLNWHEELKERVPIP